MLIPILLIVLACLILFAGAELLVRGGASLALKLGLIPLVVGLTVVAFGTTVIFLPILFTDKWQNRTEGLLLIGCYAGYLAYMWPSCGRNDAESPLDGGGGGG